MFNIRSCMGILVAVFCVVAQAAQSQSAPSAYELMRPPQYTHVELSPSGNYAAFVYVQPKQYCLGRDGRIESENIRRCLKSRVEYRSKYGLGIADLTSGEVGELNVTALPDDYTVNWVAWANDDKLLTSIAIRTVAGQKKVSFGASRIYAFDRKTSQFTILFSNMERMMSYIRYQSVVADMLWNDPDHVLIPARQENAVDLWRVNINSGEAEKVADGASGIFFWFTDGNGKPTLRFDYNRTGTRMTIFIWSDARREWEELETFKRRRKAGQPEEFSFFPIAQTDDPSKIYVHTNDENDPRQAIKIFDLKQKVFVDTVFEHPVLDVGGAILSAKNDAYEGVYYYDDRLTYEFNDAFRQKHYDALSAYFGGQSNVRVLGFNEQETAMLVYVSAPDNPGVYYLYNIEKTKVTPVFERFPHLRSFPLGTAEILEIPTRDGQTVKAYLTHPSGGKDVNAPLIVRPHGGPEVRDIFGYNPNIQFLATRGYQILQVNFRGSSGYGREFAEAGYGEWGGIMQDDVTDAVTFLHENGYAQADKTCIVGASYGGYVALFGGGKTPELYRCVVSVAGVSDLKRILIQDRANYGSDSEVYDYWQESIGELRRDKDKLEATSPVNFAADFEAPVLLVHGDRDSIVAIKQSTVMESALKRAKKDVEFLKLEDEGHNNWSVEAEVEYLEHLEGFLQRSLE